MDSHKISLLFNTIKYLRLKQLEYRLFYGVRNRFFKKNYDKLVTSEVTPLNWENSFYYPVSYIGEKNFSLINLEYTFENEINWNITNFGKLWTYNLNYFDFLNQEHIKTEEGLNLINDYIKNDLGLKDGKEPYPISLRGVNWIKFLSKNKIVDEGINQGLYNHYQILANNIEYHLLGNHLLENGFSLFFGACYFKDEVLYSKATKILIAELKEQVLKDGAHFELSPMYHQIVLHRILDCIQLVELNVWKQDNLLSQLKDTASKMLSWLEAITFNGGTIPMANDSAYGIAPTSNQLFEYAKKIGIHWAPLKLSDSGYRMFKSKIYELFVDVGDVGPTYQPGHVHSDTFSFELQVNKKPVIVDPGISTYEKNAKRQLERETASHNTVKIGSQEQTQVWGGFRVAKRAKIVKLKEEENLVEATHNGYRNKGILHTRKFIVKEDRVVINDSLSKETNEVQIAFFHLHPNVKNLKIGENEIELCDENIRMRFSENLIKIEKETYEYALGFNKTTQAQKIKVHFKTTLETQIYL
ncbi:MAG: heparinase II/III domain-containing protein [Lutibacter sp.]